MKNLETMGNSLGDALEQTGDRRAALRGASLWGAGLMLATAPALFGALAKKAYANHTATPMDVLQFALTLEYLEAEFYVMGVAAAGLIPASDRQIFVTIRDHEVEHVEFLRNAITAAGATPVAKPTFDFTAGGNFNPFGNYADFLALAQAFEDTGVRAYKGGAPVLIANKPVLTAALTIHSVEARHASEVRRLRGAFLELPPQKGWITGKNRGVNMPEATQAVYEAGTNPAVYPAEDNVVHATINVSTLPGATAQAATEAFDEPLDIDAVLRIADLFIVGDADGDGTET
ncbi:MAG TPA: ferritin-like domain-containing protein [Longimicrobium sp.]|nr:ferritin-like domain-containing protein [Longimicrobium sp.]